MHLRKAEREDYPVICQLFTSEQELFWIYPKASYPFTTEQLEKLAELRRELTVAVIDDQIVGFANLYDVNEPHYAFIGNVVVSRAFRGKGLGRTLVTHMIRVARENHALPEVRISVFSDNVPALLLYTSCGFEPYRVEPRRDFINNRVALLHMKLRFPDKN